MVLYNYKNVDTGEIRGFWFEMGKAPSAHYPPQPGQATNARWDRVYGIAKVNIPHDFAETYQNEFKHKGARLDESKMYY